MIKKEYQKPEMNVVMIQETQMLCGSLTDVTTTGLDDDNLELGGTGNINDAYSRRHNNVWDDYEDEEW